MTIQTIARRVCWIEDSQKAISKIETTIFDNILLTDDVQYAKKLAKETWESLKDKEKEEEEKHHQEVLKRAAAEGEKAEAAAEKLDPEILNQVESEEKEDL